jgi:general stress protein 26
MPDTETAKAVKDARRVRTEAVPREALDLVNRRRYMVLGAAGGKNPYLRALTKNGNQGLQQIWFCTKRDSQKVRLLKADSRASLYFLDPTSMEGLMLHGNVELIEGISFKSLDLGSDTEKGVLKRAAGNGVTAACAMHPGYVVGIFHTRGGNYARRGTSVDFKLPPLPALTWNELRTRPGLAARGH